MIRSVIGLTLTLSLPLALSACAGKGAIADAQRAVLRDPNAAESLVVLGDTYRRANRDDEASEAYMRAGALAPDNEEITRRLGGASSGEIHDLEQAVLADPSNDELWGDLGDLYVAAGDRATALRHYQYALTLDPDDSEWQNDVIQYMDPADMAGMIDTLVAGGDDERIGDIADRLKNDGETDAACELYMRALEIDPDDSEWIRDVTECPGGEDMRERLVASAVESGDDERIGDAADMLAEAGEAARACELYLQAHDIDPDDNEWVGKAMACPGGEAMLEERLSSARAEGDDEGIGDAADALKGLGREDEACDLYREALAIDEDDSEWMQRVAECDGTAVEDHDVPFDGEMRGLFPGGDVSARDQGQAALAAGDTSEALRIFTTALEERPTDSMLRTAVLALSGSSLVDLLEDLSSRHADDDELWGDLGDAYLDAGRSADALRAYQRAAELDSGDSEWSRKLDLLDPSRRGGE